MYIKRFRQNCGGQRTTYVALAHNISEKRASDGKTQTRPHLVLSLGREDALSPDSLQDLVAMADVLYTRRIQAGMSAIEAVEVVRTVLRASKGTLVESSRPAPAAILETRTIGMRLALSAVWKELGLDVALQDVAAQHRVRAFDLERLVFGLIWNRITDPMSKRAANEWLQHDAFMPEAENWDVQHHYRALDLLHEHADTIEARVGEALLGVSDEADRQVFLVDTSSLYFESLLNDAEIAALEEAWSRAGSDPTARMPLRPRPVVVNEPALRMQGHSKDGHPGDPQVVLASVCLRNGLVVRHRVYPGNTNDRTIAQDLVANLPQIASAEARVWVSDGGMTSKKLFEGLSEGGWHWLVADSPRQSAAAREHVLPLTGRYAVHPSKRQFSFRQVILEQEDTLTARPEALVLVRNALERERQLARQAVHLERVKEALGRKSRARAGHGKAVCAVIEHPSLKRYVTESEKRPGHYILDTEAIRREEQLAGTRMLRTTLTEMSGWELFDGYQLLQKVEQNHRELKGPLALRPVYHRSAQRIRAHVMLAVTAANCVRRMETLTGLTIGELRKRLERVNAHRVRVGRDEHWMLNELPRGTHPLFDRLGIEVPPL